MKILLRLALVLVCFGPLRLVRGALTPDQVKALPPPVSRQVHFSQDIKPIFEASCIRCHARGRSKGGLRLDTRQTLVAGGDSGPAVVVGKSERSLLIKLVSGADEDEVMPRKGSRLTKEQVGLLRAWIDQGLEWDPGVTFTRPPPRNLTPRAPDLSLPPGEELNPIDALLASYYKTNHFEPAAVVSDRVYARRVYLDVIGLLPRPEELQAFLADTRPDKRARLVRQLLADDQEYAAHWLSFWDDLLRNDYRGTGYIDGGREQISSWLYDALATNMPYDRFVAQLIDPTPASEGFVKGIVWRGVVNASQTPAMQAAQNISQVFMGVNLKCASCHDSFINDWKLSDAYGLAAVYSKGPLELVRCDKPTGVHVQASLIYPQLGSIDPKADRAERLAQLAALITGPKDGRLTRTIVNRLWNRFFGYGLVEPLDDMEQASWDTDLLDWLGDDLAAHHYDLKETMFRMLTSRAYQLPARNYGERVPKPYVFTGPLVRRMSAEQFRDAVGQVTGIWYPKPELAGTTTEVRASLVAADPLTTALGRPDREQVVTERSADASTLQALELTNGGTLAVILQRGAEKLAASSNGPETLIDHVYQTALGREPTAQEMELAAGVVGQPVQRKGVEDLLWAVTMLPEFQLIY